MERLGNPREIQGFVIFIFFRTHLRKRPVGGFDQQWLKTSLIRGPYVGRPHLISHISKKTSKIWSDWEISSVL